ncbi:ATP-binding protein [Hydrogenophaga soli]
MAERVGWLRLSLFWRTFLAQVALIAICLLAWVQTFVALEFEPQTLQSASQIASLVNLTRAALQHADPIARVSLVKTLADEERLKISPRERTDTYVGYGTSPFTRSLSTALAERLGPGSIVAGEVNGDEGLWVAFNMDSDSYWLLLDPRRVNAIHGHTWLIWLTVAAVVALAGAALIARMVSHPLQALSDATALVGQGRLGEVRLDEEANTAEIQQVNRGFNHMVKQLDALERDRRLMLAGISHDVRTPLARLRLEAEMSVPDEQARQDMVADMTQIESIVQQFMDYARPDALAAQESLETLDVHAFTEQLVAELPDALPVAVHTQPSASPLHVRVHPLDLKRALFNLIENAGKYGRTTHEATARIDLSMQRKDAWVCVTLQDHGPGVAPDMLERLTQPFYRTDTARSQASGAGLGLAIVDKLLQRMGGKLVLESPPGHGLKATLWLRAAPA